MCPGIFGRYFVMKTSLLARLDWLMARNTPSFSVNAAIDVGIDLRAKAISVDRSGASELPKMEP
jgi:hypothetical protein